MKNADLLAPLDVDARK